MDKFIRNGVVSFFNSLEHYGFVKTPCGTLELPIHTGSMIPFTIRTGQKVSFVIRHTQDGPVADYVDIETQLIRGLVK